jgi:hypothetical protein
MLRHLHSIISEKQAGITLWNDHYQSGHISKTADNVKNKDKQNPVTNTLFIKLRSFEWHSQ